MKKKKKKKEVRMPNPETTREMPPIKGDFNTVDRRVIYPLSPWNPYDMFVDEDKE